MKELVKLLNNVFIMVLLAFFYIFFVGVSFIVYKLVRLANRQPLDGKSYWQSSLKLPRDRAFYKSSF
ncbi:hypothetical protein BH09PAT1_BH09PAT1_5110 [soil metagenome]